MIEPRASAAMRARVPGHPDTMFQLRDGIHWCECSGRAIFLDARADRYSCLGAGANAAFLRLTKACMQPGDRERLEPLVSRGVLLEADPGERPRGPPELPAPQRDLAS